MQPKMEKPKNKTWRLDPTGLAKPSKTHGLTVPGLGLARQYAEGSVFETVLN